MKKKLATKVGIGAALVIAVLLVICPIISKPWRYLSIKGSIGVSEEEFMQKMEKLDEYYNTTNFSKNAKQLLNLAQEKDYNEYFAPAVMCVATNGGTETKGANNYWTWDTIIDKRAAEAFGIKVGIMYATPEVSINSFFGRLEQYGNVTYEEFSRNSGNLQKPNGIVERVPSCRTRESDIRGKELYKIVKWIKSL